MSRLIDADALNMEILRRLKIVSPDVAKYANGVLNFIANASTIEAEPVRHGRWETELDDMGWIKHTCPFCDYVKRTDIHVSLGWNYCPNCGAKLDLEE